VPQLLVPDVDDDIVRLLEQRATRHGRSTEAEHRAILEATLRGGKRASFLAIAEQRLAELRGRAFSDSAELIRADRDRDSTPP
jgi:plasmid stability protein